ncbi:hypothetical protein [Natrinema saccharevitans]|uniref:hypothetical protein n=1 Tax=Natrinema saccharevitans TaxID=301967 RepID=UPI00111562A7|nr:hypothetical protein [Natrinema saccharevitans]
MESRRKILFGSVIALGGAIAGCTSLEFGSDDKREYSIAVYNRSDTFRTFRIHIGNQPGESFHTEEVELEANSADETIPFDGVPGGLTITVDAGDQWDDLVFPWPVQHGGGVSASEAQIQFWPETNQEIVVLPGPEN